MRYGLARLVLGSSAFSEISHGEFAKIVQSIGGLLQSLYMEEKFDLLIGNYLEFENAILSITTRSMVTRSFDYDIVADERIAVNRRISNLLSSCRGYLDQTSHHLSSIFRVHGDTTAEFLERFKEYRRKEHSSCLGYEVMEALRNHVQHRGFPISGMTYEASWIGDGDNSKMMNTLTPYIEIKELEEDRKFKKITVERLKAVAKKRYGKQYVDVKPLVRDYVSSLGKIHKKIREDLGPSVRRWENTIDEAVKKYTGEHPSEGKTGLAAVKETGKGMYSDAKYIFTKNTIDYRQALEQKNRSLGTLARRYVTSEAI